VKRAKNRRKIKNYILNKKQLVIVIISTVYFFLSLIAVMTVIIAPIYSDIFQSNEAVAQIEAAKDFILLSEKLAIAISAIFTFTIVPLIWITHKFFGPLVNFTNIFQKVTSGDLTARIILRRGDLLKSEAVLANEMIQSLGMAISEVKKQNHHLVATLHGIVEGRCPRSDLDDEIIEAQNQARICETLLSKLQTAELPDQGQTPDESPEIPCPKFPSSKVLKDLTPGPME
jgi:methyl-accepting chemotaxis protein